MALCYAPAMDRARLAWPSALSIGSCHADRVDGHSQGNPRLYELIEHAPKTGKSPTVWAWPELIDYLKIAGQPVAGPWPPHQEPRPDPERADPSPFPIRTTTHRGREELEPDVSVSVPLRGTTHAGRSDPAAA